MKIVRGKDEKTVKFEDLDEGDVFREVGDEQLKIKTDDSDTHSVCLENGEAFTHEDDAKVIRVACELRIL